MTGIYSTDPHLTDCAIAFLHGRGVLRYQAIATLEEAHAHQGDVLFLITEVCPPIMRRPTEFRTLLSVIDLNDHQAMDLFLVSLVP